MDFQIDCIDGGNTTDHFAYVLTSAEICLRSLNTGQGGISTQHKRWAAQDGYQGLSEVYKKFLLGIQEGLWKLPLFLQLLSGGCYGELKFTKNSLTASLTINLPYILKRISNLCQLVHVETSSFWWSDTNKCTVVLNISSTILRISLVFQTWSDCQMIQQCQLLINDLLFTGHWGNQKHTTTFFITKESWTILDFYPGFSDE